MTIKDLKKGIGVNDRYVFVNELFRETKPCMSAASKKSMVFVYGNSRVLDRAGAESKSRLGRWESSYATFLSVG